MYEGFGANSNGEIADGAYVDVHAGGEALMFDEDNNPISLGPENSQVVLHGDANRRYDHVVVWLDEQGPFLMKPGDEFMAYLQTIGCEGVICEEPDEEAIALVNAVYAEAEGLGDSPTLL